MEKFKYTYLTRINEEAGYQTINGEGGLKSDFHAFPFISLLCNFNYVFFDLFYNVL